MDMTLTNGILTPYAAESKRNRTSASESLCDERTGMTPTNTNVNGAETMASRARRTAPDMSSQRGKNLALMLLVMTQFVIVIDALNRQRRAALDRLASALLAR